MNDGPCFSRGAEVPYDIVNATEAGFDAEVKSAKATILSGSKEEGFWM